MRAREILDEDYSQNLQSDINNLLIAAKGFKAQNIPTQQLVDILASSGYSVTADSVLGLLQNNPIISSATSDEITLAQSDAMPGDNQGEEPVDSAAKVKDMARQTGGGADKVKGMAQQAVDIK